MEEEKQTKNIESKITDSECIFHKIKKDNIAHRIHSTYSCLIERACKGCDGYNLNCKDYQPCKGKSIYEFYNN